MWNENVTSWKGARHEDLLFWRDNVCFSQVIRLLESRDFFISNMTFGQNKAAVSAKMSTFIKTLMVLGLFWACGRAEIRSAVIDKSSGRLTVIEGYHEDFVAWANFTNNIETSGWVYVFMLWNFSPAPSINVWSTLKQGRVFKFLLAAPNRI